MAYRIAAISMTLSYRQGHSAVASIQMQFFVQLCSRWRDFTWCSASRGPSAIAEPAVDNNVQVSKRVINGPIWLFRLIDSQKRHIIYLMFLKVFVNGNLNICMILW